MNYEHLAQSMYFTADHYSDEDDSSEYYSSLVRSQIETRNYTSM